MLEPPAFVAGSEPLARAYRVASEAHAGHSRAGGGPYLEHPIAVANLLREDGHDETTLVAALLHDVVEKSDVRAAEVFDRFGHEVGTLVMALTEDAEIEDWEDRKRALREQVAAAAPRALAVYAADRLANLADWRATYAELGESAIDRFRAPSVEARVRAWDQDLRRLEALAPDLALVPRLRRELAEFEAERAARRGRYHSPSAARRAVSRSLR